MKYQLVVKIAEILHVDSDIGMVTVQMENGVNAMVHPSKVHKLIDGELIVCDPSDLGLINHNSNPIKTGEQSDSIPEEVTIPNTDNTGHIVEEKEAEAIDTLSREPEKEEEISPVVVPAVPENKLP